MLNDRQDKVVEQAIIMVNDDLDRLCGDYALLPWAKSVFKFVSLSVGILNNGGFQYFFEMDFEGHPTYEFISDCFREVGAVQVADIIDEAVERLFPFPDPHLDTDQRNSVLESHWDRDDSVVKELDSAFFAAPDTYEILYVFIQKHAHVFRQK